MDILSVYVRHNVDGTIIESGVISIAVVKTIKK
jgi:hypothetical protein